MTWFFQVFTSVFIRLQPNISQLVCVGGRMLFRVSWPKGIVFGLCAENAIHAGVTSTTRNCFWFLCHHTYSLCLWTVRGSQTQYPKYICLPHKCTVAANVKLFQPLPYFSITACALGEVKNFVANMWCMLVARQLLTLLAHDMPHSIFSIDHCHINMHLPPQLKTTTTQYKLLEC